MGKVVHKIVFLDIDGVLLTFRPERYFDEDCYTYNSDILEIFIKMLEETEAELVLISVIASHPNPFDWIRKSDSALAYRLRARLHPVWKIDDVTVHRGASIDRWLKWNEISPKKAVVIDDSIHGHDPDQYGYHFIKCTTEYGMGFHQLDDLYMCLKQKDSE